MLSLAFGVIRLVQLVSDALFSFIGGITAFGRFGLGPFGPRLMMLVLATYLLANFAGAILLIIGGCGVIKNNAFALRKIYWGAILVAVTHIVSSSLSAYQISMNVGRLSNGGYLSVYLSQMMIALLNGLLLPAFLAFFASRRAVRQMI